VNRTMSWEISRWERFAAGDDRHAVGGESAENEVAEVGGVDGVDVHGVRSAVVVATFDTGPLGLKLVQEESSGCIVIESAGGLARAQVCCTTAHKGCTTTLSPYPPHAHHATACRGLKLATGW
jgi:hypothetical protein